MPAPRRYPSTHEQLLALARAARAQALPFDLFWVRALRPGAPPITWATAESRRPRGAVIWPRDTTDRNLSIAATEEARECWRRAYLQLPATRGERALVLLNPILERFEREFAGLRLVP